MAILDDFLVDYTNKRIYHDGAGTTVYTVRDLYSALQNLFDELTQLDDPVPMSAATPTDYTMINGWFIDSNSVKYLSGGAIGTSGWDEVIRVITLASSGYTECVVGDIGKLVTGTTTGDTGTLLWYDNTARKWYIRMVDSGDLFDEAEALTIGSGTGAGTSSGASITGESLWSNVYTLGTIVANVDIYVVQNATKLTSWWSAEHIDILVLVKEADVEIDEGKITVFARQYPSAGTASLYDHFQIDLSVGGRSPVPLATSLDSNNTTAHATVSGYNDITLTFGSVNKNLNNGSGSKPYDLVIDLNGRTVAQMYEYLKYITRGGSTFDCDGTDGELFTQLDSSYTEVKPAPFGTFAGGKFFGAQGVWIENYAEADAQAFQLIDSNGDTQVPPNSVSVIVGSVVSGDRVAVFRLTGVGGTIDTEEYAAASGNDSGDGAVVVKTAISGDTPQTGIVRIDGDRYVYSSWTTSTFTLDGVTLSKSYAEDTDVYVPLIDKEATTTSVNTTLIYSADIPVLVRVRKYGILPFEAPATVASTGMNVNAIRTTDGIVS